MGRTLLVGLLALFGVLLPFYAVNKILDLYYSPTLTGTGPPLAATIAGFGIAVLVASCSVYIAARVMRQFVDKPTTADPLEETEELPE